MSAWLADAQALLLVTLLAHQQALIALSWFILAVGIFQNMVYALQLPAAYLELREHSQAGDSESDWQMLISDVTIPISVILPAFNEEATIAESTRSMLALEYPEVEIIVVNDGSTDRTLEVLIEEFALEPTVRAHDPALEHAPLRQVYKSSLYGRLLVVDKENGRSKADASNAGINLARHRLFCVVDADSLLDLRALLSSVRPFMEHPQRMVAVGGTIRVLNGCTVRAGQIESVGISGSFLPLVQTVEYLRAFLMARLAWSRWRSLSIVSGAFGIFDRNRAIEVGGFSRDTVGEDYELIMKLHRHMRSERLPYLMRYVPEPVCWTEAPETLRVLGTQRRRWQRGALEVFFKHAGMMLNPRFGRVGMLGMPTNFVMDVLGPVVEVLGYLLIPAFWAIGVLNVDFLLAWVGVFFLFGVFISAGTLILEEMELKRVPRKRDLLVLIGVAVLENFGYRQLNNLWRALGWVDYLRGKSTWGEMKRKGFRAGKAA